MSDTVYVEFFIRVTEEHGARGYTKQRLEMLERTIESIFENDKNEQSGIADFTRGFLVQIFARRNREQRERLRRGKRWS